MILEIKDCIVSSEILTECFSCDFMKCKGCCCIVGDSGAPLLKNEAALLEEEFPKYAKHIPEKGLKAIEEQGFSIVDGDGDLVTPLVGDCGECAYSITDKDGFTLCAVEKEWCAGNPLKIRKPISCWLYPIRVSRLSNGLTALNLSREHLCGCAFEKGKKEGIPVYRFLREPLVFLFGEEFYSMLSEAADSLFSMSSSARE